MATAHPHLKKLEKFFKNLIKKAERVEIFESIQKEENTHSKNNIGLYGNIASMVGTFYLAQASFEFNGAYVEALNGRQFHPLFLDNIGFQLSLFLIILGFAFQIVERFWESIPKEYRNAISLGLYISMVFLIGYIVFYHFTGIY